MLRDWLKSAVESQNGGSALDILKVDSLGGIGVGESRFKARATRCSGGDAKLRIMPGTYENGHALLQFHARLRSER